MPLFASGFALLLAAAPAEAYVADGETLVIGGTAVQIAGIDAPRPGTPAGDAAQAAMRAIVAGRTVMCRSTGERHGARVLAACTAAGEDLGAALVASGHALDCAARSAGRYRALEPAGVRDRLPQSPECAVAMR